MSNSRLVYSTDLGRISTKSDKIESIPKTDGVVRIRRESKGRKGKGVSIVDGLPLNGSELKALCTELKKQCGCGGAVKQHSIEIQGDVRDKLKMLLETKGYTVKLAGG